MPDPAAPRDLTRIIELLFFAYRDFIADPDDILEEFGFGRAHHRVVHFVGRHPGITVAGLLDVLRITKQSLARVLQQLVGGGFVERQRSRDDQRRRLLFLTARGEALAARLSRPQRARVARALDEAGTPEARAACQRFLAGLINKAGRPGILRTIDGGKP